MSQARAAVRVTGRVQGVWFRQSTKQTANLHKVKGWARNNPDGSVEAVFEGEENAVKAVVDWCRQGPQMAHVENLELEWSDASGEFSNFQIS